MLRCIGLPERSPSSVIPTTPSTNQCSDSLESIDYTPAYILQKHNVLLQNNHRSMLKDFIGIFTRFSQEIKECKDKWYRRYAREHTRITSFKKLWELFGNSVNATDDFIDRLDSSIKILKDARNSIPKPDKEQSLKFKITQARSEVDRLTQKISELEEQEKQLHIKLQRVQSKSPGTDSIVSKRFDFQIREEDVKQRQATNQALIKQMQKSLDKQKKIFHRQQAELFEESKDDEIELYKILKKQSSAFVKSLDVNTTEFSELLNECDPEKELKSWEKNIFRNNTEQSDKPQSNENEISHKKTKSNNHSHKDTNEDG